MNTTGVTNVSYTSASGGGEVTSDGGSAITAHGVCWNTTGAPVITDSHTTDGSGTGVFTSSLSNLTPGITYYVRAYAINGNGIAYGDQVSFSTLQVTIPTLATAEVTNIGQTTATSGGNVTADGGSAVTVRGVCWSITPNPTIANTHTFDGSGSGSFISQLTGLTTFTGYYVRAYATNSAGTSYGNQVSFYACGGSFNVNHVTLGGVAPVNKTVTYGTVNNIPGETSKCWIISNLGADHQATAVDDATEPSAGWYWQFNRKQGYKHDGSTRTPNTAWISSISENSNWIPANDPCALELGIGWRVPNKTEWINVDASGNWTDWNGPWGSGLKLHAAGFLHYSDVSLGYRGSNSYYWSSTQDDDAIVSGVFLGFNNRWLSTWATSYKASGFSARCVRDY